LVAILAAISLISFFDDGTEFHKRQTAVLLVASADSHHQGIQVNAFHVFGQSLYTPTAALSGRTNNIDEARTHSSTKAPPAAS